MFSRRSFLVSAAAASLTLSVRQLTLAGPSDATKRVALLSDTHIPADITNEYRGFKPVENLKAAISEIVKSNAEFAMLCGDAARFEGKLEDYVQLKKQLEPLTAKMPIELTLGNHDDRANFWKVFGGSKADAPLAGKKHVTVVDFGPQIWVMLDSLMYVDKVPGHLGQEQRQWLDKYLAANTAKPVFLMVHHTLGERDGDLLDTDKLLAIAAQHPHVRGVVFGHSHVWSQTQIDGLWHINLPAVGYNFADEQPVGWVMATLAPDRLTLNLSAVGGNRADSGKEHVIPLDPA